jgi:glutathione S-transferase
MPTITLYSPANIPFCTKVRAGLGLKKLEYQWLEPQSQEDYLKWSPKTGQLPVLQIDDEWTEDSGKILDLLDDRYPNPPFLSPDPKVARSQRRLEEWAEAAFMFYWVHYLREIADTGSAARGSGPMAGEFAQRLDDLVNFLGGRPFFYSDEAGRADIGVYSWLSGVGNAVGEEVANEVNRRPALREFFDRVEHATGIRRDDVPE